MFSNVSELLVGEAGHRFRAYDAGGGVEPLGDGHGDRLPRQVCEAEGLSHDGVFTRRRTGVHDTAAFLMSNSATTHTQ